MPPLAEQSRIIEQIGVLEDRSGRGIEAGVREIDLLREYRTRLIADVVTGRVDVREAADGLPEIDSVTNSDTLDAGNPRDNVSDSQSVLERLLGDDHKGPQEQEARA